MNDISPELAPPQTTIIIDKQTPVRAYNSSNDTNFDAFGINLARNSRNGLSYYQLHDLSNTHSVGIYMQDELARRSIDLEPKQLDRMATYLRVNPSQDQQFDCASFVHYVNDVPYQFGHFKPDAWQISSYMNDNDISTGETILITKKPYLSEAKADDITHFAIYLGDGVYLSKFGVSGKLIAATLPEMQRGFGGEHIFRLKPNVVNDQ